MAEFKNSVDAAKSLMQGAMSLLGSSTVNNSGAVSTNSNNSSTVQQVKASEITPEDIPKEDLVHLCMKLNKRMQAMETKGQELIKKKTSLSLDKHILLDFLKHTIKLNIPFNDEDDIDASVLKESWIQQEIQNSEYIVLLENKITNLQHLINQNEANFRNELLTLQLKVNSDVHKSTDLLDLTENENNLNKELLSYKDEITKLINEKNDLNERLFELESRCKKFEADLNKMIQSENLFKENISNLEEALQAKSNLLDNAMKSKENEKSNYEEQILYLQMQLNASRTKEDVKERELTALRKQLDTYVTKVSSLSNSIEEKDILIFNTKSMILSLETKLSEVTKESESLKDKIKDYESMKHAASLLKLEQEALINGLKKDLKSAIDNEDELQKKINELEQYRIKTEGQLVRLASLSEQVNQLQNSLEDKNSLITRLRSEAQTNERNHAMRTAMLATCESQLEILKSELIAKDKSVDDSLQLVTSLQNKVSEYEKIMKENELNYINKISEIENDRMLKEKEYSQLIEQLKITHEENIEHLKKDYTKKSNLARILMSEKEEEAKVLSAKVIELQKEIASGAPTERRIFELAQTQAKRDGFNSIHSDNREIAFLQLQESLAQKDLELAKLQQKIIDTNNEIAELRRINRRETVNMDYLKNITLQYMTFPISSPERMSLIPVLATLLQFNSKEISEVDKAAKDPNWNARPVKEIKRSLHRASNSSVVVLNSVQRSNSS